MSPLGLLAAALAAPVAVEVVATPAGQLVVPVGVQVAAQVWTPERGVAKWDHAEGQVIVTWQAADMTEEPRAALETLYRATKASLSEMSFSEPEWGTLGGSASFVSRLTGEGGDGGALVVWRCEVTGRVVFNTIGGTPDFVDPVLDELGRSAACPTEPLAPAVVPVVDPVPDGWRLASDAGVMKLYEREGGGGMANVTLQDYRPSLHGDCLVMTITVGQTITQLGGKALQLSSVPTDHEGCRFQGTTNLGFEQRVDYEFRRCPDDEQGAFPDHAWVGAMVFSDPVLPADTLPDFVRLASCAR